jgi:hypothetical protein
MLSIFKCDDGTKLIGSRWIPAFAGMTTDRWTVAFAGMTALLHMDSQGAMNPHPTAGTTDPQDFALTRAAFMFR